MSVEPHHGARRGILTRLVVAAAVLTAASGLLAARWITERHTERPR